MVNIEQEIKLLEINFYNQISQYFSPKLEHIKDKTFRSGNWIITFPFNFIQTKAENELILIRKLSIINAIYVYFFFREDNVIDEYHLPSIEYKAFLMQMCEAHSFRNLAIGQLINLCGEEIFDFIFEYEKRYYDSLIFEKLVHNISIDDMLKKENLIYLGNKVIPLCLTFAGYCLKEGITSKIKLGEELLINYHIAHQLYDDIVDFEDDIKKPDLSYTIKIIKEYLKKDDITVYEINNVLQDTGLYIKIIKTAQHYLKVSKKYANELNFLYFRLKINDLEKKFKNLKY